MIFACCSITKKRPSGSDVRANKKHSTRILHSVASEEYYQKEVERHNNPLGGYIKPLGFKHGISEIDSFLQSMQTVMDKPKFWVHNTAQQYTLSARKMWVHHTAGLRWNFIYAHGSEADILQLSSNKLTTCTFCISVIHSRNMRQKNHCQTLHCKHSLFQDWNTEKKTVEYGKNNCPGWRILLDSSNTLRESLYYIYVVLHLRLNLKIKALRSPNHVPGDHISACLAVHMAKLRCNWIHAHGSEADIVYNFQAMKKYKCHSFKKYPSEKPLWRMYTVAWSEHRKENSWIR